MRSKAQTLHRFTLAKQKEKQRTRAIIKMTTQTYKSGSINGRKKNKIPQCLNSSKIQ
jgi:hypothetical protein